MFELVAIILGCCTVDPEMSKSNCKEIKLIPNTCTVDFAVEIVCYTAFLVSSRNAPPREERCVTTLKTAV